MALTNLKKDLRKHASKQRAAVNAYFFKTGKGQYGEGDKFIGVRVGDTRKVAKAYKDLPFTDIKKLLTSPIHEERQIALLILVHQYETSDEKTRKKYLDFYLKHTKLVNNWDLVDLTAPKLLGAHLLNKKDRSILYKLAKSKDLWEQRIAIVATYTFIRNEQYDDTLNISEMLLDHKHDLIHKAVGWMLREVGKKHQPTEEKFLKKHYETMPRTTLRYAIERFDSKKKSFYMGK